MRYAVGRCLWTISMSRMTLRPSALSVMQLCTCMLPRECGGIWTRMCQCIAYTTAFGNSTKTIHAIPLYRDVFATFGQLESIHTKEK